MCLIDTAPDSQIHRYQISTNAIYQHPLQTVKGSNKEYSYLMINPYELLYTICTYGFIGIFILIFLPPLIIQHIFFYHEIMPLLKPVHHQPESTAKTKLHSGSRKPTLKTSRLTSITLNSCQTKIQILLYFRIFNL